MSHMLVMLASAVPTAISTFPNFPLTLRLLLEFLFVVLAVPAISPLPSNKYLVGE